MLPLQSGDVEHTYADVKDFISDTGYQPNTLIEDGVEKFINWFKKYYKLKGKL